MSHRRLIALCSPVMGSGKSTIAQHLVDHHGFVRLSFATPLKQMAMGLLHGMDMNEDEAFERVYGSRKDEMIPDLGVTSRWLQQRLGTEFGRKMIRESIWYDLTLAAAVKYDKVVIDDLRFPDEYLAVEGAGGSCYRVVRPDAPMVGGVHASEGQLDGIVMPEIFNGGSLDELFTAAERTLFA